MPTIAAEFADGWRDNAGNAGCLEIPIKISIPSIASSWLPLIVRKWQSITSFETLHATKMFDFLPFIMTKLVQVACITILLTSSDFNADAYLLNNKTNFVPLLFESFEDGIVKDLMRTFLRVRIVTF